MSTLFLRTLREDPSDAEVAGHRLLVRAGYIRRAAPGCFTWLPLGWIVLRNIERVVREEMDRAGFQEVHFPALLPREPYEATGRWTDYGDNLFRLKDRRGADFLLAPTHEEMFTLLVKDLYSSYKDLPLVIYQIQTKYRDEARPRAGLLRGREFVMKDSYSFDIDDEGLQLSYDKHLLAHVRSPRPRCPWAKTPRALHHLRLRGTPRPCRWPRPPRCPSTACPLLQWSTRPTHPRSRRSSTCSTPAPTCAARIATGPRPTR
jgi:prolyl-tRNA synthetase